MNQRPSLRLGMGHLSTASNGMYSCFTDNAASPISTSESANPSPVSSFNEGSERSCYSTSQSPLITSPQFRNPFGRSHSLSVGSPAFQRQGLPSSHNSMMGLGDQPSATTSPISSSLVNNTYGYGSLPPLQCIGTPLQTRDDRRFGKVQNTGGSLHESGMGICQNYISPLPSPGNLSYDQSQIQHPSGSVFRASSYCQTSDTISWQESEMSPQGFQYRQRLQPPRTGDQLRGSELLQSPVSRDPVVNRYDQRSYSYGGEQYRAVSPSTTFQSQPMFQGVGIADERDTQPSPDAARPRAMSDTFPAYYSTQ